MGQPELFNFNDIKNLFYLSDFAPKIASNQLELLQRRLQDRTRQLPATSRHNSCRRRAARCSNS